MTTLQVSRRLFSVHEYHLMARAGILCEDDRVELIDGEIVEMAPIGSRHAARVDWLTRVFTSKLGEVVIVRVQNPIGLGERNEPQPNITLLRPRPDFYANAHPSPEDILLVIDVADSSLDYTRGVKVPLYARAEVAETWLMDLVADHIELYRQSREGQYRQVIYATRGEQISPQAFPNVVLSVDELLGPSC